MSLIESSIIGSINVTPQGMVEVRRDDLVLRDGVIISTAYHRQVLAPGDDLTDQDPRVAAIAAATWTPDVVSAYRAALAATESGGA